MCAREDRQCCRSLMVVGVLVASAGPLLAQSANDDHTPPGFASAPVFQEMVQALPQFLDQDRASDLHNAWHMRAGDDRATAAGTPGVIPEVSQDAMFAARAAMERRKAASEQASQVRERAEALSRLFAAGSTSESEPTASDNGRATATITTAPMSQPASAAAATAAVATSQPAVAVEAIAPATDAPAVSATAAAKSDFDPPFAIGGPVPEPESDAVVATPDVLEPVTHTGALTPEPRASDVPRAGTAAPPLPQRAPESAERSAPAVTTTVTKPTRSAARAKKPDPATIFPSQLRAFGWNTQPE